MQLSPSYFWVWQIIIDLFGISLVLQFCIFRVSLFLIIPKWQIKASGHIPIHYWIFRIFQKSTKYGPWAPYVAQKHFNKYKKHPKLFLGNVIFASRKYGLHKFWKFSKRPAPTNDEESFNKIMKSWIWDQYLSKSMNGILLIWYQYLLQNIKWHLGIWELL